MKFSHTIGASLALLSALAFVHTARATVSSTPFTGTAINLPAVVEVENYDKGGEGVAYHDTTTGNSGGVYRSDGVDLRRSTDAGATGYTTRSFRASEWLAYSVSVATAGTYNVDFRVASNGPGGSVHLTLDGADVTGPVVLPNTGTWNTWKTVTKTGVVLTAGAHHLKLVADKNGSGGTIADFNWFMVYPQTVAVPQPVPSGVVINVPAGGDLQAALNTAKPGDSIVLASGQTYVGHFVLRDRGATAALPIRVRSSASIPIGRVSPATASLMAKIKSPDDAAALETDPGVPASGYVLSGLEFEANETQGDLLLIGINTSVQTSLSQVPHDIEVDRCYIHGTATSSSKRGVSLNAANVSVHDSYIADFHRVGQDTQDIAAVNGPGPMLIENDYLGGATEDFLIGGDDPKIPGMVPAGLTFRHNYVTRPMSWKGGHWQIKNLFELKIINGALVENNTFENNWAAAQQGTAILFTVRNQNGAALWSKVSNIIFRDNVLRNVGGAFQITGYDNEHTSLQTENIAISQNVIAVDGSSLGGDGRFLDMEGGTIEGAKHLTVDHNTVDHDGSSLVSIDGIHREFEYTDNLSTSGVYGFKGTGLGVGNPTIVALLPSSVITNNVIAGASAKAYPVGNFYPTVANFLSQFVDFAGGNYALASTSIYKGIGADVATVLARTK